LEKLCHPGLEPGLGGYAFPGSCANASIDAASKPNAMQQAIIRIGLVDTQLIYKLLSMSRYMVKQLHFQTPDSLYFTENKGIDWIRCPPRSALPGRNPPLLVDIGHSTLFLEYGSLLPLL
jgi:hypothetical protein